MTVVVLGLCSAIVFGAADFCGGAASKRASAAVVLLICLPVGLILLLPAAIVAGSSPTAHGMVWGAAAGIAGGTGLLAFYPALARGPMSVVAPVSALIAAVVPVVVGFVAGERLGVLAVVGIVLCLAAIAFVSMEESARPAPARAGAGVAASSGAAGGLGGLDGGPDAALDPDGPARPAEPPLTGGRRARALLSGGPVLAILAGLAFGTFFVLLREAGDNGAPWALVSGRGASVSLIVVVALARWLSSEGRQAGQRTALDRTTIGIAVAAGVLDATANALYLLSAQAGTLSVAAVLTSLYPAVTVLLACVIYGEQLRTLQRAGLAVALAGVTLVTIG